MRLSCVCALGLENIEGVIGVPIETFLAEWAATLYLDDRGVAGRPARLDFPSWNLPAIYNVGLPASAKIGFYRDWLHKFRS